MYISYHHRTVFRFIIKQHAILARGTCWISQITGIVSWSSAIVENQLLSTSARSYSTSASSAPLKSCPCHPCALVRGSRFGLNPIGGSPIHHQFIAPAIRLIMPYRPTKFVEQLLWCLYKLLQQMTVICGMFSCYLTDSTPQCRPHAWSFLSFWPQRHRSSSYNIV